MKMPSRSLFFWSACLLGWSNLVVQSPTAFAAEPLVRIVSGDLPIILSAPHGGLQPVPGVMPRQSNGVGTFNTTPDLGTDKLTEEIADALEKQLGKRPYVVIARFHRKYLDANRSPGKAYEAASVKEVYDAYHDAIQNAREEIVERFGFGLLLDIHGQNSAPNMIFRGTNDGRTANHLANRFGRTSLTGPTSLFGELSKNGLQVYPAVGSSDPEEGLYNGGYIVANYGSRDGGTFDAIQLDIGKNLRSRKTRQSTAEKMASAIVSFRETYLQIRKQDS